MCASIKYYVALNEISNIGFSTLKKLLLAFGDFSAIFEASVFQLKQAGLRDVLAQSIVNIDWHLIEPILRWQQEADQHILTIDDANYPERLREIASPPIVLYIKGRPELLSHPQLAIVGSRHPTPTGQQNAQTFATSLAQMGLMITSGLALGVDTAGHQGALQAGKPTIAVLGTGLATIYPARNRWLAEQIAESGALVSEFPLGMKVRRENFPRRNRIISGLSMGVLVVEAALHSGSLITARFALEQGREVFAMPGSIHNPLSRGCHRLLRDGAKLVQCVEDVAEELLPMLAVPTTSAGATKPGLSKGAQKLLDCIGESPTSMELIAQRIDLAPDKLSAQLLQLEMQGVVRSTIGGYQRL